MSAEGEKGCLFQVAIRLRGQSGLVAPMSAFPFSVGRSARADLRIDAAGVWDQHLRFELEAGEGLFVQASDGALVRCQGETVTRVRVRHGDEIEVGAARLSVGLGPVRRKALGFWEAILTLLFAALLAAQVGVGWWLVSGSVP